MEDSTENVVWGFPLHPLSLVTVEKPGFTTQTAPEEAQPRERVSVEEASSCSFALIQK